MDAGAAGSHLSRGSIAAELLPICARYHSVLDAARLKQFFAVRNLRDVVGLKPEVFPGYSAPFIRRSPEHADGDQGNEAVMSLLGLLPHWTKDTKAHQVNVQRPQRDGGDEARVPGCLAACPALYRAGRSDLGTGLAQRPMPADAHQAAQRLMK
jgi:hypothetical protein